MGGKRKQIAIYGAGGFGGEIAWLAEACGRYKVVCFIDDNRGSHGLRRGGIPVMGIEDAIQRFPDEAVVVALGSPKARQDVVERVQNAGFDFERLIHPRTEMSKGVEFGKGTVVCAGCSLTTNIRLGDHVQINLNCTIGHDVIIDDYTTLSPGVHVSGWAHFGKRVFVGTGAVFINGTENEPLTIGEDAVIGAGAVVTKSVPSGETWVGRQPRSSPRIHEQTHSESGERFSAWQHPVIEENKPTQYSWMVQYKDNLNLGHRTDIGAFTYINAKFGVTIEDHVQIGSHCSIYSVSTIDAIKGPVILKKNCMIGSHSVVMPGVTIGENAVVGAMSYITQDVPDNAVALGVPAKVIKRNEEQK